MEYSSVEWCTQKMLVVNCNTVIKPIYMCVCVYVCKKIMLMHNKMLVKWKY